MTNSKLSWCKGCAHKTVSARTGKNKYHCCAYGKSCLASIGQCKLNNKFKEILK